MCADMHTDTRQYVSLSCASALSKCTWQSTSGSVPSISTVCIDGGLAHSAVARVDWRQTTGCTLTVRLLCTCLCTHARAHVCVRARALSVHTCRSLYTCVAVSTHVSQSVHTCLRSRRHLKQRPSRPRRTHRRQRPLRGRCGGCVRCRRRR